MQTLIDDAAIYWQLWENSKIIADSLNKPWYSQPATWSAVAASLAVLVALFGKKIRQWLFRPRLKIVKIVQNTQRDDKADNAYWRVLIENTGWDTAREVEVHVIEITRKGDKDMNFLPVPLQWTHYQTKGNNAVSRDIHPNQSVYLDFCWKENGDYRLRLATPIHVFSGINEIRRDDLPSDILRKEFYSAQERGHDQEEYVQGWINNGAIAQNELIRANCKIFQQSGDIIPFCLEIQLNGNELPEITIV